MILKMIIKQGVDRRNFLRGLTPHYISAYRRTAYHSNHYIVRRKEISDFYFSLVKRQTNARG